MKSKILMLITLCLLTIGTAVGQTISVKGIVQDEKGEPVVGATVRLKADASVGTRTGIDGDFTLKAKQGEIILVTYIGYKDVEVAAAPSLVIKLVPDAEILDDVVIIGYGSGRSVANTSASVVKVNAKQIEQKPSSNPFDALQGKVSGMQVFTSSGEPGEISSIKIHGAGSLTSGTAPLFILDGVPVSSGLIMSMNQNDFESVQVLKDAAATSIYGARAANGVIYITSKKGRSNERASVTFRGYYGISSLANPQYFERLANTNELLQIWQEYGIRSKADIDAIREKYGQNNTKWYKFFLKDNRPTYSTDVAISGGTGKTRYYSSVGYYYKDGMRPGSDYKKLNFRLNLNTELNKYVSMGMTNAITYDIVNSSPYARNSTEGGGIAVLAPPFYTPYDKDGKEYMPRIPGWNRFNPNYSMTVETQPEKTLAVITTGNITIRPFEGLTLRSNLGVDISDYTYTYFLSPKAAWSVGNGVREREFSRGINFTNNNTIEYKFNVAEDNHFTLLAGHEYIAYDYDYFYATGKGIEDERLPLLPNTTKEKNVSEKRIQYAFLSYFGQFSYDYKTKYFLDLVVRNDASSRFGANKKNGTFWSAGFLWKAKKESFLEDVEWLSDLDFKVSSGVQGNADIGNYQQYALVGKSGQYKGNAGWALSTNGNDNLSWERQFTNTVGLTFGLFDKLNVNVEFYDRLTTDMLMDVPMPLTTGIPLDDYGFASILSNVAKYRNTGVDLGIKYDILKGKDYGLDAYLNFNYNKDKVVELFDGKQTWILPNYGFGYIVGQPINFLYPIWKGVNKDTGKAEWYLPGEDISVTQKDDSKITNVFSETLEQNTGVNRYPRVNGGWGLSGNYKGFSLQADFTFVLGKYMISNDRFFYENPYRFAVLNQDRSILNYWKKPGDVTEVPSIEYITSREGGNTIMQFDSRMIQNASFMRLKNLTVGYQIPTYILERQDVVKGAKVYFTGRNLLTFTKFTGTDPEIDSNLTFGAYPNSKEYVFGLEFTF